MSVFEDMPGVSFYPLLDTQPYPWEEVHSFGTFLDPNMIGPSLGDAGHQMTLYPEWYDPQQAKRRLIEESQKIFFQTSHLPTFPIESPRMDFSKPHEATGSMPHPRGHSPRSPSSISSCDTNPCTEGHWYPSPPNCEDTPLSCSTQGPSDLEWQCKPPVHGQIPLEHIGLNKIQKIPDPEEVTYMDDENYMDVEMKIEFLEADNRFAKQERSQEHYRRSGDEALSQSLKIEGSPELAQSTEIINGYTEADVDAEGELEEGLDDDWNDIENPIAEEEDQDQDYRPKASRAKNRRSNRISPSTPGKKQNKVTKAVPRSMSQFQCKTCSYPAKDAAALVKHITAVHTRPYVCTFSFAGCRSTFGNKNEWKRHVYSQHLNLRYWLCNVGNCAQSKASTPKNSTSQSTRLKGGGNEFNRKDLFTQHLRRMHCPLSVKRQQKKNAEWEEQVKQLQSSCLKVRRTPPTKTKCPVLQCALVFEGASSWDDRMEHVGRHLEKMTAAANGATSNEVIIDQERDEFMIEWALRERIIERRSPGVYRLYNDTGAAGDDGDADCEDE